MEAVLLDKKGDVLDKGEAVLVYRHPISRQGWACDELVSLFQKAVRRGEREVALAAFAEVAVMAELFPDGAQAKALRTQAVNRISVTAMEDVGVANPALVLAVLEACLPLTARTSRRAPFSWATTAACIEALCASRKTRVQSWLYHAYGAAENAEAAREEGLAVRRLALDDAAALAQVPLSDANCFQCIGDAAALETLWRRLQSSAAAWPRLVRLLGLARKQLSASSQRACIALALALQHYGLLDEEAAAALPLASVEVVRRLRCGEYEVRMLEGAVDKHTAAGRAQGKTTRDFRREGTRVAPEDKRFKDPRLEELYLNSKRV